MLLLGILTLNSCDICYFIIVVTLKMLLLGSLTQNGCEIYDNLILLCPLCINFYTSRYFTHTFSHNVFKHFKTFAFSMVWLNSKTHYFFNVATVFL